MLIFTTTWNERNNMITLGQLARLGINVTYHSELSWRVCFPYSEIHFLWSRQNKFIVKWPLDCNDPLHSFCVIYFSRSKDNNRFKHNYLHNSSNYYTTTIHWPLAVLQYPLRLDNASLDAASLLKFWSKNILPGTIFGHSPKLWRKQADIIWCSIIGSKIWQLNRDM